MNERIVYSVVLPVYNEAGTIPILWKRLSAALAELDGPAEVLFVNDASEDESRSLLEAIVHNNARVRLISLSRNFGHQAALTAGIDHAQGEAVVLMDADLQDEPESIASFASKWREGYHVVYAVRRQRKENLIKRLLFSVFYRASRCFSNVSLPMDAGIFSLMDHRVVDVLRKMPERNRYISGLRGYAGFRQVGIPIERGSRFEGRPRVTLVKLFKLAFDAIFSFSTVPLRLATFVGLLTATGSLAIGVTGLYYKYILHQEFLSWPYGLTTAFFFGGLQLFFLGIIGEYIGRIYDEVKQRPYYIVGDKAGFDEFE